MFTSEQYDHGFRSAQWMEKNGGSFASNLAKAYYRADLGHAKVLYENFPHIFALDEFKAVKKHYKVLITLTQYRVVTAESAEKAREVANQEYMDGKIDIDAYPEFSCEECDALEGQND